MEPTPKHVTRPKVEDEDIDLGQLFYKTGGVINNFFKWLDRLFRQIGRAVLAICIFLLKNLLWIALGLFAGLGYGYYVMQKNGPRYSSSLTLRANFNSAQAVYGSVDLINALISNGQNGELSKIFGLSQAEVSKLRYIQAQPVKSEMIVADMYKNQFLNFERNTRIRMDTFWIRTIDYKNFKSSLTDLDYPIHEITVKSGSPVLFQRLQQGLINQISANKLLQQIKSSDVKTNQEVIEMLTTSIKSLDTLRDTYKQRLLSKSQETGGYNLTLMEGPASTRTPELELYDKMLELKDELKDARSKAIMESDIIQVLSPFGIVGKKEKFTEQPTFKFGIIGLCLSMAIIILLKFYRYLKTLETKQRTNA